MMLSNDGIFRFFRECERESKWVVFQCRNTFPALSGSSVPHACFSYIFNQAEFKQSPLYSAMYSKKMDAINKYLQKNVSTQDQALTLFIDFYEEYVHNPPVKPMDPPGQSPKK